MGDLMVNNVWRKHSQWIPNLVVVERRRGVYNIECVVASLFVRERLILWIKSSEEHRSPSEREAACLLLQPPDREFERNLRWVVLNNNTNVWFCAVLIFVRPIHSIRRGKWMEYCYFSFLQQKNNPQGRERWQYSNGGERTGHFFPFFGL